MALPFTSLNAATATGPGTSRDLESVSGHHTMLVSATGSPSSSTVRLEGSHDGTTWANLGNFSFVGPDPQPVTSDALVRYVRANVTQLSGGTSPTITATIASEEED